MEMEITQADQPKVTSFAQGPAGFHLLLSGQRGGLLGLLIDLLRFAPFLDLTLDDPFTHVHP